VVAAADVFVRPTRADGDAVSVREALALGRGVVATRVGHRPDACLLVPRDDAEALTAAMLAAAAAPRTAGDPAGPADPFERILGLYATLTAPAPRTDGGRPPVRAPTF
jgi:glycosyltransferase involved in cell wall biosynthesis